MRKILIALLLLTGACSGRESTTTQPTAPTDGEPTVLVEVRDEGGFAPVEWLVGRMPRYVLMSDGTLYGAGITTLEFPGRLLPSVATTMVDAQTMTDLRQYVEDIGFADIIELRDDQASQTVADAPDTVVTYFDDGGSHVFSVYGLGMLEAPTDIRVALLAELVGLLDQAAASGVAGPVFVPERIEVYAGVREMPVDPQFEDERPWPLTIPASDLGEGVAGWGCLTLEGEEMTAALEAFDTATQATDWIDSGTSYGIVVRYLHPHQQGC